MLGWNGVLLLPHPHLTWDSLIHSLFLKDSKCQEQACNPSSNCSFLNPLSSL